MADARVLVAGRTGQLACALIERAQAHGIPLMALGRPEIDLARFDAFSDAATAFAPTVVVNAAAYTAVDKAEEDVEAAFAINVAGAGRIAAATAGLGLPVIHVSTDYVFDGEKPLPYAESDATNPLGVYGRSKLEGEESVAQAAPMHVILRTAWVYSSRGGNFVKTMLRLAGDRDTVKVVADQHGCPTYAPDLADAILSISQTLARDGWRDEFRGIFHTCGTGETSWHGFAEAVFDASGALGGPMAEALPIPTTAYPTPARRPANSRLDCTRLETVFGLKLPPWRDSLQLCVSRLLAEPGGED